MKRHILISALISLSIPSAGSAADLEPALTSQNMPAEIQTVLGKYMTVSAAHKAISDNSDVLFIDVRNPVAIGISGHPDNIDAIVPLHIQTNKFNTFTASYELADNPKFVEEFNSVAVMNDVTKNDKIILISDAGIDSAQAVNVLAKDGYENIWHVVSADYGSNHVLSKRQNLWKSAGLPWSKELVYGSEWRLMLID